VTIELDQTPGVDVLARLFDPEVMDDPGPFYAWLLDNVPVHRHRSGSYLVARHADAKWMFQTDQLRAPEPEELAHAFPRLSRYQTFRRLAGTVVMTNPPTHTRLRRLLTRDFTVKTVSDLVPRIEAACDAALDRITEPLRDGTVVDLHTQLTVPFAQSTIFDLIGIDQPDRSALGSLVATALHATSPASSDEAMTAADAATDQVETYYTALVAQRRAHPREDMISALVAVHDDDRDRLSHDELMCWLWGLWAGGFETTACSMDNSILSLLRHPEQAHWLRGDRAEVRAFVNETLRYRSASHFNGAARIAVTDLKVGGVTIPEGTDVRAMPGCANRDPAVFPDPDRFDPCRDTSETLTFGHGMHYCLGANLARVQLDILLPRLHARFPTLALAEPPVYRRTPPLLAFNHLSVALEKTG
jgi:cytochrome P450 family 114